MTLSETYDRLLSKPVHEIQWCDGSSPFSSPIGQPIIVRDVADDTIAEAWIEPTPEGLVLHFNARTQHSGGNQR